MKPTSYLPAEELLARYPGRLAAIKSALAACHRKMGLKVPESLEIHRAERQIKEEK